MMLENQNAQMASGGLFSGKPAAQPVLDEPISIPELRSLFKGQVIGPQDEGYDLARTLFYGGIDRRPAVIVRPRSVEEVARAVNFARQRGLDLAVRGGGHSFAGHSVCDEGLIIDLRDLRSLDIDPASRTAWAGGGLTAGEYTSALSEYGLATGFGDTGSVGIGGITLGGGVGYLVRKHGLTIDNLQAVEMVTADGGLLHVDESSFPDLFWAVRGGGGNFGVVTRFKYQLQEVPAVLGGMLILPATPRIIANFLAECENAPEELSGIANVMPCPPMPFVPEEHHGKLILMALMAYAGDIESGERVLAPFRSFTAPIADMIKPIRYAELFPPEDNSYHPTAVAQTMFINHVDYATAETMLDFLQKSDAPMRVVQLRALGGAMARVPVDATAYAHRQSRIMVNLAAFYNSPEERLQRQAWVADFARAIDQGDSGAYVNFLGDEGPERIRAAYPGQTWDRLAQIKARYDPYNIFRMNHNIPPAPVVS